MRAEILKIQQKPSKRGGMFKYIFFKELGGEQKSYKTCVSPEFRNYGKWATVEVGQILDKLFVKSGRLIDADSDFEIIAEARKPKTVNLGVVHFGIYKGKSWSDVPVEWLRYLVSIECHTFEDHKELARTELNRRGISHESEQQNLF